MNPHRRRAQIKSAYLIGGGLIALFSVIGLVSFTQAMVPYVTIDKARAGDYCQVTASVLHATRRFNGSVKATEFYVEDEHGDRMKVSYGRTLPANFDQVPQVSLKGQYRDKVFHADEVLTK